MNNALERITMPNNPKRCFVLMPFSKTTSFHTEGYWNNHYENFLKPLINSCSGVEAFRSVPIRQDILRQIINDLVFSPIVVADLTDSNPNVYWELGVRLSFRHGTVTIANEGFEIPFDIKTKGVLFYSSESNRRDYFQKKFKEAINDCLSNPERPDSIVLETITGRGSVYSLIHHQENVQRIGGLIEEIRQNYSTIKVILERINWSNNRKFSSLRMSYGIIVTNLGHSALDLLLAERYIEEEAEFYLSAYNVLFLTNTINENLSNWTNDQKVSKWFKSQEFRITNVFEQFHSSLVEIKQQLLSKC
jgi:hypothetical protein